MGFISFGGLYFGLGGLSPPKPMPGYFPGYEGIPLGGGWVKKKKYSFVFKILQFFIITFL